MTALDTSDDVARRQRAVWAALPGAERVSMALEMAEAARVTTVAGIRSRNPDITEPQLMLMLVERFHGASLASEVERSGVLRHGE